MLNRREVMFGLLGAFGAAVSGCVVPRRGRGMRVRRRVRRRIRRRIRRRVAWRVVTGRRRLVVPLAVAVGWELMLDSRVVVVRQVKATSIIIITNNKSPEEIEVEREDTADNREELQGTEVPAGETGTPVREVEEDVEEEVEG